MFKIFFRTIYLQLNKNFNAKRHAYKRMGFSHYGISTETVHVSTTLINLVAHQWDGSPCQHTNNVREVARLPVICKRKIHIRIGIGIRISTQCPRALIIYLFIKSNCPLQFLSVLFSKIIFYFFFKLKLHAINKPQRMDCVEIIFEK